MRFFNSVKNLFVSWFSQLFIIAATFITRYYFVQVLGSEYLGINGLFANILSMLSLADLGIGVAISCSLYKPLEENDVETLKSIMSFFRRIYRIIGAVIICAGIAIAPFLRFFIKEIPAGMDNLYVDYILYVLYIGVSYFTSYKSILIIADQKKYIDTVNYCFWFTCTNVLQIIVLQTTANYSLFLLVQLVCVIIQCVIISGIADRMYPFLKEKNAAKIGAADLAVIKKNTFGMIFQKLGSTVVGATDNLVISRFIGLKMVGLYANYFSIINAVNMLMSQIFTAIVASVGNFNLSASREDMEDVFQKTLFINFWAYGFASISLYNLLNPFITLWLGGKYVLTKDIVFILCLNFYLNGMRQSVLNFRNALGVYWEDRMKPVVEAVVNLLVSIVLVKFFGMMGVFLGTTISVLAVTLWWEPHTLYRYGIRLPMRSYFISYWKYFFYAAAALLATACCNYYFGIVKVYSNVYLEFLLRLLLSVGIVNLLFFIFSFRTEEYRGLAGMVKNLIASKKKKCE